MARRFRISPLVIGMTIVAFGTSAPELLVSTISAIKGSAGIAMGNVVGSNIANIGLILGLTALICPIETDNGLVIRHGSVMIAASLLLLVFALNSGISRIEATPKSTSENTNAKAMRNTFNVRLPNRLEPNSLSSAVAVHENATPIDISSPIYVIIR